MSKKILITDGANRVALAVIRALADKGYELWCCEQRRFAGNAPLSFKSKYIRKTFLLPNIDEESFADKLFKISQKCDIVIPISINTILKLAKLKIEYPDKTKNIIVEDYDKIKLINNKKYITYTAKKLGLDTPQVYEVDNDNYKTRAKDIKFPAVIKLATDENLYLPPAERYVIAKGQEDFINGYEKLSVLGNELMVEEYIDGVGYGFFAVLDKESNPLGVLCHKRLREYPLSGGPSTLCESVREDEIIENSNKLLKELKWTGVGMVEYKKDINDGKFKIMEINPRFWGSLPLGDMAGVNFPLLLCEEFMGCRPARQLEYKLGVKLRFTIADIIALFGELKIGKIRVLIELWLSPLFLLFQDGIFSFKDPLPFFYYLKNRLLKRHE